MYYISNVKPNFHLQCLVLLTGDMIYSAAIQLSIFMEVKLWGPVPGKINLFVVFYIEFYKYFKEVFKSL